MSIIIPTENQEAVDKLRIDIAQVGVDLAEIQVHDMHGRHLKDKIQHALRTIRGDMDAIGLHHSRKRRCADGNGQ